MKNHWILFVLLIVGCVFLIGCAEQGEVVCDKPYIQVGTDCCLDQNDNGVCDSDEGAATTTATATPSKTTTPTPTPTPSETATPATKKYVVIITGSRITGDRIKFANQGGPDAGQLASIFITVNKTGSKCGEGSLDAIMGSTVTIICPGATISDELYSTVTASFKDGTTQVIFDSVAY